MTKTALEQALVAYTRADSDEQQHVEDVIELASFDVFSKDHLIEISGLSKKTVYSLVQKTGKAGGRFNPESLPLIYDLWLEWTQGGRNVRLAKLIVKQGTSPGFLEKLTGIPRRTITRWTTES